MVLGSAQEEMSFLKHEKLSFLKHEKLLKPYSAFFKDSRASSRVTVVI